MKKILLSAALFAACCAVKAQTFHYVPYADNVFMTGATISNNGKYVGGCDAQGRAFIHNTETGETKYFVSERLGDDTEGEGADADIRAISNDGVGVGYFEERAATFDFATGKATPVTEDMSVGSFINADGNFSCGFTYDASYSRQPYYMTDGELHYLPQATDEWLGYESNGFSIAKATNDGSIILGSVMDNFATFPMVLWVRNRDNSSYSVVPVSKRFYDASFELDGPQPYDYFEGASISANGKYVAVNIHPKGDFDSGMTVVRYDVQNDSLTYINCPAASGSAWYYANAISNDGTIVGYIENQMTNGRTGFICKGGETEAQSLAEAFPTLKEIADMDNNDLNSPSDITPDGRYIEGFGYVEWQEGDLGYATYYIDTQSGETGVESVADAEKASKVVASYSADGKKLNRISGRKGLVINKMANGKVVKTVK